MAQIAIPCLLIRGGTSNGAYFLPSGEFTVTLTVGGTAEQPVVEREALETLA